MLGQVVFIVNVLIILIRTLLETIATRVSSQDGVRKQEQCSLETLKYLSSLLKKNVRK
jgi:hypothetical protein